MTMLSLFSHWRSDPDTAPNISTWRTTPARFAQVRPFPADLPAGILNSLNSRGITSLYSHQAEAWIHARQGENIVLATGTASGKTLGYNLPVLASLLEHPEAKALYLFPTKALTQDQTLSAGWITFSHRESDSKFARFPASHLRRGYTAIPAFDHPQEFPHHLHQSRHAAYRHPAAPH